MKKKVMYPGSFDPITIGHINMIERGAKLFDEFDIVLAINRRKNYMFNLDERVKLVRKSVAHIDKKIDIKVCYELLASFGVKNGYSIILRGFRDLEDFLYELKMQRINKDLSGIETVFLASEAEYTDISSKYVKEISSLGADISKYVPPPILNDVIEKIKSLNDKDLI